MWSTLFNPQNGRRYQEICPDSSLLKTNITVQMFNNSWSILNIQKKVNHILESSLDFLNFFKLFMSFSNYRKSNQIFKCSLNSHVYWDILYKSVRILKIIGILLYLSPLYTVAVYNCNALLLLLYTQLYIDIRQYNYTN